MFFGVFTLTPSHFDITLCAQTCYRVRVSVRGGEGKVREDGVRSRELLGVKTSILSSI